MSLNWSEEQDAALLRLRRAGFSYTSAGREIGKSKGSCISRFRRVLSKRLSDKERALLFAVRDLPLRNQRRRYAPRRGGSKQIASDAVPEQLTSAELPTAPDGSTICNIFDLTVRVCHFPVTDDKPHMFCGAAKIEDQAIPYCAYHMMVTHSPARR
jgi:hypothetical protein